MSNGRHDMTADLHKAKKLSACMNYAAVQTSDNSSIQGEKRGAVPMKDSLSSSSLFITLVFRLLTIRKHFFASSIHSPSATSNTNKQLEAIQHANSNSFSCDVGRGVGRAWPHYSISHSGRQPPTILLHLPHSPRWWESVLQRFARLVRYRRYSIWAAGAKT